MFRYIGVPLLAGGLSAGILAVGYIWFLGPPRTAGALLPDQSRITAVTVKLDSHADHPEISAFDIPDAHRHDFLKKLYRARLVCWDVYVKSGPNDEGRALMPVGSIRLFGWGELRSDWGENELHRHLPVYRLASRPNRLCILFTDYRLSERDRWLLFEADLDEAILEADAEYRKSLASPSRDP